MCETQFPNVQVIDVWKFQQIEDNCKLYKMSDIPLGNRDNNDDVLNVLADPADMPSSGSGSEEKKLGLEFALVASTGIISDIIYSIAEEPKLCKAKRLLKQWISRHPETEVTPVMKSFYKEDSLFDAFYHDAKLFVQEHKKLKAELDAVLDMTVPERPIVKRPNIACSNPTDIVERLGEYEYFLSKKPTENGHMLFIDSITPYRFMCDFMRKMLILPPPLEYRYNTIIICSTLYACQQWISDLNRRHIRHILLEDDSAVLDDNPSTVFICTYEWINEYVKQTRDKIDYYNLKPFTFYRTIKWGEHDAHLKCKYNYVMHNYCNSGSTSNLLYVVQQDLKRQCFVKYPVATLKDVEIKLKEFAHLPLFFEGIRSYGYEYDFIKEKYSHRREYRKFPPVEINDIRECVVVVEKGLRHSHLKFPVTDYNMLIHVIHMENEEPYCEPPYVYKASEHCVYKIRDAVYNDTYIQPTIAPTRSAYESLERAYGVTSIL